MKGISDYGSMIFVIFMFLFCHEISCLEIVELRVPKSILKGHPTHLQCIYQLNPGQVLYSVKWYKNNHEFYRYHPKDNPPGNVMSSPGIVVEPKNSSATKVSLKPLSLSASGKYKCEVTTEGPNFDTVSEEQNMTVIALPQKGPEIIGGQDKYMEGDIVSKECICGPSSPGATLSWLINGKSVNAHHLKKPQHLSSPPGFTTTSLKLEFKVKPEFFNGNRQDIILKCTASIGETYTESSIAKVEIERFQNPPAQENIDNRVQGRNSAETQREHLALLCAISSFVLIQKFIWSR